MIHNKRTLAALVGLMGLLGGCAGFGENFKTNQVAWAGQPGSGTLAVQVTGDDGLHPRLGCASVDDDILLMPDTKYYRDYLRVDLSQAGFREEMGRKAESFIRHPNHRLGCQFSFDNLPAGNWLLVTRPEFYAFNLAAYEHDEWGENPQQDVAPPVFMWNAVRVSADTGLTALRVEKDLRRIVRKKHKHVHTHISKHSKKRCREFKGEGTPETQVTEWNPTATDRHELGLPAMASPAITTPASP